MIISFNNLQFYEWLIFNLNKTGLRNFHYV